MHRIKSLGLVVLTLIPVAACSGTDSSTSQALGGATANTGGNGAASAAGASASTSGGAAVGGASSATGGAALGGASSVTQAAGGALATGGSLSTGGTNSTGGMRATGGAASTGGLTSTGGSKAMGGASSTGGSKPTGGVSSTGGSKSTGGAVSIGGSKSTGGALATGGSVGSCSTDTSSPPSTASAWINESWASQLGSNVKDRKDWLLDNIMLGKGQINLCVRWGASTAPTAAVKSGMAAAVQKWMNDWFTTLNYGGFPYCNGVSTKVTGWAVKPGNTSWVSDLDSSIKVYTETDADGEPKCPDSCSFFNNWTHAFPSCPGGEAYHTDYWLWLDDSIGGGAAAVGGDWGLRMPVSNFTAAMGKSNLVIEHEMGHGFGFQDYYDWTGSTPTGGSLMIVGSTNSQVPTTADTWLLRRTWMEMKALRGW